MKVFLLFALQLYLFTGARVGAFIPINKHRHQRGLRYKHIDLVLFRSNSSDEPWKIGWRVNEQWLKKNRNPEYTVFGIGIRDDSRPQFASGLLLAVIAIDQGAIYGINTIEDLAQQQFPEGKNEIPLRWKDDAKEKPVFRNVTGQGAQDLVLTTERFYYSFASSSGKQGIGKIPQYMISAEHLEKRLMLYGHKDGKTYPTSYLAHCSSINTVDCVLDEKGDDRHIEYWQGHEQYRETGLPSHLPAGIEESVLESDELAEIKSHIGLADAIGDKERGNYERLQYRDTHIRLRLSALTNYRTQWVRDRRDWTVLSKGQKSPNDPEKNACTRALALIMPEIGRLAAIMSSTEPMSFDEKLLFMKDLQKQCSREYDIIYLPNEAPIHGKCPIESCQEDVDSLAKSNRSRHIHECVRRDKASQLGVRKFDMEFCYEYPLCGCPRSFDNAHDFCHHLYDVHGLAKGIWQSRNADNEDDEATKVLCVRGGKRALPWEQQQGNEKRSESCAKEARTDNHGLPSTSKVESKYTSMEPKKKRKKETRFFQYQPSRPESQQYPSNHICITKPARFSFVEDQQRRFECSARSDRASASSRSNSIASYFSDADSRLSSQPTTPGLDVIDPRILVPIGFNIEDDCPGYDQEPIQLNAHSLGELETKELNDTIDPKPPVPSPAKLSREDCTNEVNDNIGRALETYCPTPSSNTAVAVDDKCKEHPHTQAGLDGNPSCND
ncbi:uncharacterized protein N7515_004245 [Penicillium bovifimosum]|uniref:C2H2-type domain-containing protein n=1 Tax=Penicillium bovifimosum TaxID=126998 RepID=A0A9W9H648_9EURO|nr:uncharacterized protein N7515_004245 [Penicillium bovifimosum]KAJ5139397.1 hypothetical protein N7515_004245 [Penicillium bovifimosum]